MKPARTIIYYFVLVVAFAIGLFQSVIYSLYTYDCITGSGDTSFSKPVLLYSSLIVVYYVVGQALMVRNLYLRQPKIVMIVSVAVFLFAIAQILFESSRVIAGHIYQPGADVGP